MIAPAHWEKYTRWDVIARWRKQVTATAGSNADVLSGALSYPYAFASNDPAFRGIAGGVLWLVSSPQ